MVPTFMRMARARRGSRSCQRPSFCDEALPAVVGAERVAAGGAVGEAVVEVGAREGAVGAGGADFGEEGVGVEGGGAGGEQDVLAEDVEGAGAARLAVEVVVADGGEGGVAFEHLEAVGGDEDGAGGGVVAVVGAADALDEALDVLRRADLDDEVDVAPVDAEVERAGGDDGAELPGDHGGLDLLAGLAGEGAVVEGDGEGLVVLGPEVLEEDFGLGAGVDEDEGGAGAADQVHDAAGGVGGGLAGPGGRVVGGEDGDVGLGAGVGEEDARALAEPGGERRRVLDGGGEADAAEGGGEGLQAGEGEHQLVAALALGQRVDLVDDDAGDAGENARGLLVGEHEGEGFGRGEQDVRRVDALAGALARRRCRRCGPRRGREVHLGEGGGEVAADVGGERLERRDVEGVEAGRRGGAELDEAEGRKPASVLPPPVGATRSVAGSAARARSASWCGCGVQPRRANQAAKKGGRTGAGPLMPLSIIAAAPSGHGARAGAPCGQC